MSVVYDRGDSQIDDGLPTLLPENARAQLEAYIKFYDWMSAMAQINVYVDSVSLSSQPESQNFEDVLVFKSANKAFDTGM